MRTLNAHLPIIALIALSGCMANTQSASQAAAQPAAKGEWRSLFDGKSASAWRGYKMDTMPAGWTITDSTLGKTKATEDIVTREQFTDFEFEMEWKLARGGNSGLFYRASEEFDRVYWSAPEYQLLDDANAADGRRRITSAGSAHSLYEPPVGVVKPFGEWNSTRVVVKGTHVEHWMNGQKLFEFELWTPEWDAKVQASKFRSWAKFGKGTKGHIAIQGDHNGDLTLRNIRIREF